MKSATIPKYMSYLRVKGNLLSFSFKAASADEMS
jgi:hypothetical protein